MLATNLRIVAVVAGCLGVFTWVANVIPQVQSDVPEDIVFGADVTPEELVAAGTDLYNGAGGCTACHGLGERAPNLLTDHEGTGLIGVRCENRVSGQDCKQYLYASLVDPAAYLVEGFAPIMLDASRTLSSTQIWALVAYLEAQGGDVTVTGADLEESGGEAAGGEAVAVAGGGAAGANADLDLETLLQMHCNTCHNPAVELPIQIAPPFEGMGSRMTAEEIRAAILDPNATIAEGFEMFGGTMPPFFGDQLTAAQLEAMVQYLASRQ